MQQTIIDIVNQFGYWGIGLLIAIENLFPPTPSEVILAFGGFLTTISAMSVMGVTIASTIGTVAGALCLYGLGHALNAARLERMFEGRLGRALRLKKEDVGKAESWFSKHGRKTVFFCRFIPIVRSLISIPAGMAGMKMRMFLPLTISGTFLWNFVLILLGRMAGSAWESIAAYFDTFSLVAELAIAAFVGIVIYAFIKNRFMKSKPDAQPGS